MSDAQSAVKRRLPATNQHTKNTLAAVCRAAKPSSNAQVAASRISSSATYPTSTSRKTAEAGNSTTTPTIPTPIHMTTLTPTQAPRNIILFHTASRTLIGLTPEDERKVYAEIECTINGDGLYEGASKETILQAYHDLEMGDVYGLDWVDHITHILEELDIVKPYIKR